MAHLDDGVGVTVYRRSGFNPFASNDRYSSGFTTRASSTHFDECGVFMPNLRSSAGLQAEAASRTEDQPSRVSPAGGSYGTAVRKDAGGSAIVVAGVNSDVGLHFIRLLNESPDFSGLHVRGLVLVPAHGFDAQRDREAVIMARRRLDDFCGEDTSTRVALVAVAYCSKTLGGNSDATIGGDIAPGVGLRPGLLTRADCLHPPTLRAAMGECAYVELDFV